MQSKQSRLDEINIELNLNDKSMEIFDAKPDEMGCEIKNLEKIKTR